MTYWRWWAGGGDARALRMNIGRDRVMLISLWQHGMEKIHRTSELGSPPLSIILGASLTSPPKRGWIFGHYNVRNGDHLLGWYPHLKSQSLNGSRLDRNNEQRVKGGLFWNLKDDHIITNTSSTRRDNIARQDPNGGQFVHLNDPFKIDAKLCWPPCDNQEEIPQAQNSNVGMRITDEP